MSEDQTNYQLTNSIPEDDPEESITIKRKELQQITERQDQQIADLVACYKFMERMAEIHEIMGGSISEATKIMANPKKRERIQQVMGSGMQDLAERMKKYEPYVRTCIKEQGGSDEQ